jgi:hypothetical protein
MALMRLVTPLRLAPTQVRALPATDANTAGEADRAGLLCHARDVIFQSRLAMCWSNFYMSSLGHCRIRDNSCCRTPCQVFTQCLMSCFHQARRHR